MIFVCNANELNEGECKSFSINDSKYLLSKLDDRYYVLTSVNMGQNLLEKNLIK